MDAGPGRLGSLSGPAGPVVEARGVRFAYRRTRAGLEDIGLAVDGGERVVLLGPNGSGKTTLLRLFARDLRPHSGTIAHRVEPAAGVAGAIGYAPDRSTHFDELSGRENAHWFVRASGGSHQAADALLARFGLAADADVAVGEYSFGMRRKVVLTQALAHEPRLVLLDEPTVGLDPDGARTLAELLDERAAAGAAIVIATNDTRIAASADRVVFLHRGRIAAADTPAALLQSVRGTTRVEITLERSLRDPPVLPGNAAAVETAGGLVVESRGGAADLPAICDAIWRAGGRISRIDVREPGFDDVFRKLTGESLAAGPPSDAAAGPEAASRRGPPWRRG